MAILSDQHMHSSFSFDSDAPLEDMVKAAVGKGLKHINVTQHNDFNFPVSEEFPEGCWDLNIDSYLYDLLCLREQYGDRLKIGYGIELGLQESALKRNIALSDSQPFDFIIASIHLVNGYDTYDPRFWEGKTIREGLDTYFDTCINNLKQFKNYDIFGHIDYFTRLIDAPETNYNPLDYKSRIDEILKLVLDGGHGLEYNTKVLAKGLKEGNPHSYILKRYRELGGEIITVGSDAHKPENIASDFDLAETILKDCGFNYYAIFEKRIPTFVKF